MSDKITVLIVDDIADTRENLRKLLYFERDIEVVADVGSAEEGISKTRELRPDVVLMDINLQGMDGIAATEAIHTQVPSVQVIMMSVQGEAEYLRRAMLAGAREFLIKPFGSEELADSIRRVRARAATVVAAAPSAQVAAAPANAPDAGQRGKIISVFSAKGGVGRTTVACNTALAIRSLTNKRVALVDCSLQFGDVGVMLNLQGNKNIADLVPHLSNLEPELIDGILATHSSGVRVLLAPPRPETAELVTADAIKRILAKLRECYDYVVVDTWPTFQDTVLATLDLSDRILLLFTLEIPAIKNVKLFLEVADALGYPAEKLMLVVNRADSTGGIVMSDVERSLRHPIPIRIVSDGRLATYALNRGIPFVVSNPESQLAKGILGLARNICGMADSATTDEPVGQKEHTAPLAKILSSARLGLGRKRATSAS